MIFKVIKRMKQRDRSIEDQSFSSKMFEGLIIMHIDVGNPKEIKD